MSDRFEAEPTTQRKRRWGLWLTIIVLVPILGVIAYVLSVRSALNTLIADLDRTDPDWRLEEIEAKRATFPAAQNAALEIPKIKSLLKPNYNQLNNQQSFLNDLDPTALLNQQQIDALNRLKEESSDAIVEAQVVRFAARPASGAVESRLDLDHSALPGQPPGRRSPRSTTHWIWLSAATVTRHGARRWRHFIAARRSAMNR